MDEDADLLVSFSVDSDAAASDSRPWSGRGGSGGAIRRGGGQRGARPRRGGAARGAAVRRPARREEPLPHFSTYFAGSVGNDAEAEAEALQLTETFQRFWTTRKDALDAETLAQRRWTSVEFLAVERACAGREPALEDVLRRAASRVLDALALGLCLVLGGGGDGRAHRRFRVRVVNLPTVTALRQLKAGLLGALVCVRGTVARVSSTKPVVTQLAFECTRCGGHTTIPQPDGKYKPPTTCSATSHCTGQIFQPLRTSDAETLSVDCQRIRIQEKLCDEKSPESGRMPRTVECELWGDLVDSATPGDVVVVCGVVKLVATEDTRFRKNNQMFVVYLEANSVMELSAARVATTPTDGAVEEQTALVGATKDQTEFASHDLYAIRDLAMQPDLLTLLVHSLCPAIFGHELVKAGVLLTLFGGRRPSPSDQGKSTQRQRADSHLLIVGDPGLGKSQILAAAVAVAPRGVYVCGNTATAAGLTVTMVKDAGTGDSAVEAGALVLGDQGCCFIDEFDKMTEHQALLEAMEQQSVSIAKAGMVRSLPARTSVIAAANPVGGHYNKAKSVSENLKMAPALLSRFDLIFILLDRPNVEMDLFLSKHIMSMHQPHAAQPASELQRPALTVEAQQHSEMTLTFANAASAATPQSRTKLEEQLKRGRTASLDLVPPQLLRKYIAYTRQFVHPRLTPAAARVLQRFYLRLRQRFRRADATPITNRQLESLVRLSQARARLECREEVLESDARDVVELLRSSLHEAFDDGSGGLDLTRSQNGAGMSKRGEPKRFIAVLQKIAAETSLNQFNFNQLYSIATDMRLVFDRFQDLIDTLNNQGYLLHKGRSIYELTASL